jgi:hypothetical protein
VLFKGVRNKNIYVLSMNIHSIEHCLIASKDESFLWHRRCGYCFVKNLSRISKNDLVKGLPKLNFKKGSFL